MKLTMGMTAARAKNTAASIQAKERLERIRYHTEWGRSPSASGGSASWGKAGKAAETRIISISRPRWVHSSVSTPRAAACRPSSTQDTA